MPQFYHQPHARRGTALGVTVAVTLAALTASRLKGAPADALEIALITAIALVATGIIGAGTYLIMRARTPAITPPTPTANITVTVIHPMPAPRAEAARPIPPRPAIQGKPVRTVPTAELGAAIKQGGQAR